MVLSNIDKLIFNHVYKYEDSKDSSMKDSNYYYYKKEFIQNGSVKDYLIVNLN